MGCRVRCRVGGMGCRVRCRVGWDGVEGEVEGGMGWRVRCRVGWDGLGVRLFSFMEIFLAW